MDLFILFFMVFPGEIVLNFSLDLNQIKKLNDLIFIPRQFRYLPLKIPAGFSLLLTKGLVFSGEP